MKKIEVKRIVFRRFPGNEIQSEINPATLSIAWGMYTDPVSNNSHRWGLEMANSSQRDASTSVYVQRRLLESRKGKREKKSFVTS